MRYLAAFVVLFLMSAQIVHAEVLDQIAKYKAEIAQRRSEHDTWINFDQAPATMYTAMKDGGVGFSLRYAESWGQAWWYNWTSARDVYGNALEDLKKWEWAVQSGAVTDAQANFVLDRGMLMLRNLDWWMTPWFTNDLDQYVEEALWTDQAVAEGCCAPSYYWLNSMADNAFADSISPDYNIIGSIRVFPSVPNIDQDAGLPGEIALAFLTEEAARAIDSGQSTRLRAILRTGRIILQSQGLKQRTQVAQLLEILEDRLRFSEAPVEDILSQAAQLPAGERRSGMLSLARDRLRDRAGHLARMMADGARAGGEVARSSARTRLIENAKYWVQLKDDARGFANRPSGTSRMISGMSAASRSLDLANSDNPQARDMAKVISDMAETGPNMISPVAPISAPMNVVAAMADQTKKAWDYATESMDAVGDAIEGDPSGIERAENAARRLQAELDPRKFARSIAEGFIDGVANNIPFARSVIGYMRQ